MQKHFYVIDMSTGKNVWNMGACEKVFFAGQLASKLKSVQFVKRKIKLRKADESESDFEAEHSDEEEAEKQLKLNLEEEQEDHTEYEKDEDGFKAMSRGILVIKSNEEEVDPEKDKINDEK